MLLIGVSGPIGSGKSTLLQTLALWYQSQGKHVEGFLAQAGTRKNESTGAEEYDLQLLPETERLPFAVRDPSLKPPYSFDETTIKKTVEWADGLKDRPAAPLLILDEFGPVEASGNGHMLLWDSIRSANPGIVVIAVRAGLEDAIEQRLSIKFDVKIKAEDSDAWNKLRSACVEHSDWTRVGMYGAASGGFEATVGSALHGAQIPMRGLFLSSIQSALMVYAADGLGKRSRVVWVPFISAGLKGLSPAGNRLRPMLAITIQGILFSSSVRVLGWNALSIFVAGWLIGAWAAAQGVLLQYLFVGGQLIKAYDAVISWVTSELHLAVPGIIIVLCVWVVLNGIVASGITMAAWRKRNRIPVRLQALLNSGARSIPFEDSRPTLTQAVWRGVRDLKRPSFWAPVLLVAAIVVASGSTFADAFWIVARACTIGIVIFSLARTFSPKEFVQWLRRRGKWGPALAFQHAMQPHATNKIPSADERT